MDTSSKRGSYQALTILSLAFVIVQGSQFSLDTLLSSLLPEDGLGFITLSVSTVGELLGSFLAAPVAGRWLTPKWLIVAGIAMATLFIAANFYQTWFIMTATAVIYGIGKSVMWFGNGLYITELATTVTERHQEDTMASLSNYNGIFNGILASCALLQFISAVILKPEDDCANNITNASMDYKHKQTESNYSCQVDSAVTVNTTLDISYCGSNHCPFLDKHIEILTPPAEHTVYIYIGVLLTLNIIAVVLSACLPELHLKDGEVMPGDVSILTKTWQKLVSVFSILKDVKMLLWIPVLIFTNLLSATIMGSFPQASSTVVNSNYYSSTLQGVCFTMWRSCELFILC